MFIRKQWDKVRGGVPRWLLHIIVNYLPVDLEIHEGDICDRSLSIVSEQQRRTGMVTFVNEVLDHHVSNSPTRGSVVLRIVHDTEIYQLAELKIFHANIFDVDILNEISITCINSNTALVPNLRLMVVENVDISDRDAVHDFRVRRVPMRPHIDRMRIIGPQCGVLHGYIA